MASESGQATSSLRDLTDDNLGELYEALYRIRFKYRSLGLQIGVKISEIRGVQSQYDDPGDRLQEVLSVRLRQSESLTWKDIDKALRSESVGEGKVADIIQRKHGHVFIDEQLEKQVQFEDQKSKTMKERRKNEKKSAERDNVCDELAKVEGGGREMYTEKPVGQKSSLASQKVKTVSGKTGKSADIARQQVELPRTKRKLTKRAEVEKEKSTREERASDESDYQSNDRTNCKQQFKKGVKTQSDNECSLTETEIAKFHRQIKGKEAPSQYKQECKGRIRKRKKKDELGDQYSKNVEQAQVKIFSLKPTCQFFKFLLSPTFCVVFVSVGCLSFTFLPFGIAFLISLATYLLLLAKESGFSQVKDKATESGNLKRPSVEVRGISSSESDDSTSPECDMSRKLSEDESKKLLKVFKRFFGQLCCEVTNPARLAAQLQRDNLISQKTMIGVLRSPESQQEKTICLVSKLSKRVDSRPYRLYRFIEVLLRNDGLTKVGREILTETGMYTYSM